MSMTYSACTPILLTSIHFLVNINNVVKTIKFTTEHETNGSLPFLDVLVLRHVSGFKFKVYRKPTNINSFIHNFSSHPPCIKQSAFRTMFLRALHVSSPEFLDEEIKFIYRIGDKHRYNKNFIDRCHMLARRTFNRNATLLNGREIPFENKGVIVLPYHYNFIQLPRLFNLLGLKLIFKYVDNIKHFLVKNSPPVNSQCIYRIPCLDCPKKYFGQTGRHIETRIHEHRACIRKGDTSSALFLHVRDLNHRIDWNNSKTLIFNNIYVNRNLIESVLIEHSYKNNINTDRGLFAIDPILINLVNNSLGLDKLAIK
jgi:hypothetical protein